MITLNEIGVGSANQLVGAVTGEGAHKGRPYDVMYDPEIHQRRSIRLKGYDYSQAGAYFVTIVAQGRLCLFGDVVDGEMRANDAGEMVWRVWDGMPGRFPSIEMDEFVVLPNHVHGVIIIRQSLGSLVGGQGDSGVQRDTGATTGAATVGDVVGAFKSLTTVEYGRGVRELDWPPFDRRLWQRNYYERVIRDESEFSRVREYIANNPMEWEFDRENPAMMNAGNGWTGKVP